MEKTLEHLENTENGESVFSIVPIDLNKKISAEARQALLELQLKMATSSINHEYARIEFEDIECSERKEELLDYMHECRLEYFKARQDLEKYDPYALIEFEEDLMRQKSTTLTHYHA